MAEVIGALASLAWPATVILFLILFRKPISAVLGRVVRAKTPLGEYEFDKEKTIRKSVRSKVVTRPSRPREPVQESLLSSPTDQE